MCGGVGGGMFFCKLQRYIVSVYFQSLQCKSTSVKPVRPELHAPVSEVPVSLTFKRSVSLLLLSNSV